MTKGKDISAFTVAVTGIANRYGFPKFLSIKNVPAPITIGETAIPREPTTSPIFVVKHRPKNTDIKDDNKAICTDKIAALNTDGGKEKIPAEPKKKITDIGVSIKSNVTTIIRKSRIFSNLE